MAEASTRACGAKLTRRALEDSDAVLLESFLSSSVRRVGSPWERPKRYDVVAITMLRTLDAN
jgi:hypothetical protein